MAICLDYQSVYSDRRHIVISVRMQLIAAVFLLVALAGKVWVRCHATDVGYQYAKERQRTIDLDMRRRELELQRSILLRSDKLSAKASERLHLQPLDPNQARRIVY